MAGKMNVGRASGLVGDKSGAAGDFPHPAGMSSALEPSVEESAHHGECHALAHKAGRDGEHIGLVVLSGEGGELCFPAQCRPDALVLVGGHGHPVSASANDDAQLGLPRFDGLGSGMDEVGIVHRIQRIGAKIEHFDAPLFQQTDDGVFIWKTCVVAADGYGHDVVFEFLRFGVSEPAFFLSSHRDGKKKAGSETPNLPCFFCLQM